jgi:hypothetical protein
MRLVAILTGAHWIICSAVLAFGQAQAPSAVGRALIQRRVVESGTSAPLPATRVVAAKVGGLLAGRKP